MSLKLCLASTVSWAPHWACGSCGLALGEWQLRWHHSCATGGWKKKDTPFQFPFEAGDLLFCLGVLVHQRHQESSWPYWEVIESWSLEVYAIYVFVAIGWRRVYFSISRSNMSQRVQACCCISPTIAAANRCCKFTLLQPIHSAITGNQMTVSTCVYHLRFFVSSSYVLLKMFERTWKDMEHHVQQSWFKGMPQWPASSSSGACWWCASFLAAWLQGAAMLVSLRLGNPFDIDC